MPTKARVKYLKNQQEKREDYLENKKKNYVVKNMKEYNVNREIELLEFLFITIKDQSKNNIKSLLSKRFIGVNGLCVTQYNYKLYKGDIVQLSKTPFNVDTKTKEINNKRKNQNKNSKLDIIYEDNDFIVINKPSGLLSIESDKEKTETAYKLVLEYMQQKDRNARAFQVHRIDKETSGVLMFSKTYELKEKLQKNWNKLVVTRGYYAIIDGTLPKKKDTIIQYLKETDTHLMYNSNNENDGQKSITHYEVLKENKNYSMLDVKIDTGRKNQIRVAFSSLGVPIVGDDKYGEPSNPINRLGLHAYLLEIKHPENGKLMKFAAKYPSSFNRLFN